MSAYKFDQSTITTLKGGLLPALGLLIPTLPLLSAVLLLGGVAALLAPTQVALAASPLQETSTGDWVIFGEEAVVGGDQTVVGNVVVLGGDLRLEDGGRVRGDVVAVGSSADLGGQIDGNLVAVGASLTLTSTTSVRGETVILGGDLDLDEEARLAGGFVTTPGPEAFTLPVPAVPTFSFLLSPGRFPFRRRAAFPASFILGRLVRAGYTAFVVSILGALALLTWPAALERVGRAVNRAPAASGGVGCLSLLLIPLLVTLLAVSILLIPVALLLIFALLLLLLFGWVAIGILFGERLLEAFNTETITPRKAGIVGTFALTLVIGLVGAIPALGWISWLSAALLATAGVGAVVLTRFGVRPYRQPHSTELIPKPDDA